MNEKTTTTPASLNHTSTVGDNVCYDGKYQGAQGPRVSESCRTLDRDTAGRRFPGLDGPAMDPEQVGAKAATLAELASGVRVPELIAIPTAEFAAALAPRQVEQIEAVFSDLHATVGSNLTDDVARLAEILSELEVPACARTLLAARLT
ncbi:hypothetical protein ABIA39_008937 [Nocardia sp. GAS34]|uniref:hypothetical protein n=1 Tax=unclassified Nocardia TaxID=2637762 RepID=UPI003D26385B